MKNLKRVLSLALSGIMLVGMMAVGASAVDAKDFTDKDEIQNTDAVNTMVALGIITGNPDGSYDPERTVTREEMAKMITVALNGGKDFTYGTKATPSYTDIKGTWAESYIEYCTSLGIIAGNGDGTFAPKATVTGSAAAKMMLTAMGYDAVQAGMTGTPDWEINTNILAGQKDLYKDLEDINPTAPLSRDSAAQLIYNGVQATMVEYTYNAQTVNGTLTMVPTVKEKTHFENGTEKKSTILTEKFGVVTDENVILTNIDLVNSGVNKGTYTLNGTYTKVTTDYSDLLGQTVKILHKKDKNDQVFGVYADKMNTVVTTNQSAITADGTAKVKFGGTKYELDACTTIVDGAADATVRANTWFENKQSYNKISFVDNDGDNKYEVAVITTVTPAKVTYVSSDEIIAGGETYKYEDETIAEGLKKNDYVTVTYSIGTDKNVIEKIEAVEDTISGTKTDEFQIDGTWYKDGTDDSVDGAVAGDDVTVYIVNGVIYFGEKTSTTNLTDVVMLVKVADGIDTSVKFMYTDGTVVTGTVDTSKGAPAAPADTDEGKLYTVKKATNGYRFTAVADHIGDYTWVASGNIASGKVGSTEIADDAAVLALSENGNVARLYTGKQLKAMTVGTDAGNVVAAILGGFTNKVKGLTRISVVAVQIKGGIDDMPSGSVAGSNYALVLTNSYNVKDAITYDVWTGEEKVTVTDEDTASLSEGDVVLYDTIEGNKITGVAKVDANATLADGKIANVSIRGIDGDDLYLNGDTSNEKYEMTKDTVVMYYNSADMVGMAGGEIALADNLGTDDAPIFVENAKAVINGTKEISFLLVDVKNKLSDATEYTIADPTAITNASFTFSGVKTAEDGTKSAKAGDTVTVTASADDGNHLKKTNNANPLTAKVNGGDAITAVMKDGKVSFTFVMPAGNVTSIAFENLEAEADPAPSNP